MTHGWKELVGGLLAGELPGERSHRKMLPPGRTLEIPHRSGSVRNSGVLVLLFLSGEDLRTLLIRRTMRMVHHPGQIAFPGGRQEEGDGSPLAAALREMAEETGVSLEEEDVLGPLTPLYIPVSHYLVHPFAAWKPVLPRITLHTAEAEKEVYFPLVSKQLLPGHASAEVYTGNGRLRVPGYLCEGEIIWGATAMMLAELLDLLARLPGIARSGQL